MTKTWLPLFLVLTLPLFAATPFGTTAPSPSDRTVLDLRTGGGDISVIVEFHETPLLLRERGPKAIRANAAAIESLVSRLEADLDQIERTASSGRVAANAPARRIRFEYRIALAGASARVSRKSVGAIRALPYVKALHLDTRMEAHLAKSLPQIGVHAVWEQHNVRGRGIVVAVIDTGIDYNHKSLGKGFGPGFKVAGGWDFVNNDADPMDDYGHGTHVAGIVAGNADPVIGVAPEATLLAYKVLDEQGRGEMSTVLAGVERALDPNGDGDVSDRADVVNMSLGGPVSWNDPVVAAVERATAAGVVFSLSAGNEGALGSIGSPAMAPSAITVGASGRDDSLASFSSRGPIGGTWAAKPDLAAPGQQIVSARMGGGTLAANGTSMAAPHVAGVAALLLEKYPGWTPEQVKAAIVSTAKGLLSDDQRSSRVLTAGAGRLDAARAIAATVLPSPTGVSFGLLPKRGQRWTSARTLRLANLGTTAETLTATAPALPAGATLAISPETVTIAAGESAELTLTLTIEARAPIPNEDDLALTGALELTGSRSSLRVPWLAVTSGVVTATYGGDEEFVMGMAGGPFLYLWPEGPRSWGAFAHRYETVDIIVVSDPGDGTPRVVVRELLPAISPTAVTIAPEEASLRLDTAGVDERGRPLADYAAAGAYVRFSYDLFLSSNVRATLADDSGTRALRISPLTMSRIQTYETVLTPGDRYFARYPDVEGLKESRTLRIAPTDWASQRIRYDCRTDCRVLLGAGVGSFRGYDFHEMETGSGTWKLHLTPPINSANQFRAYLIVRETDMPADDRTNPWTFISPAMRNEDGRMAFAGFGRIRPTDYYSTDTETPVVLGDGPAVIQLSMHPRSISLELRGPLGEGLGAAALDLEVGRFDSEGNEMLLVPSPFSATYFAFSDERSAQRLEVKNKYTIGGRPGVLTQTSTYDSRINWAAPSLSYLRIDGTNGSSSYVVPAGSRPRLLFAARATMLDQLCCSQVHQRVNNSETRVWWRQHGTAEWQPLPVTNVADDYEYNGEMPGSPGSIFAADLTPIAALPLGAVDLKIRLVDEYNAATEATYTPALVVTEPPGRRRALR